MAQPDWGPRAKPLPKNFDPTRELDPLTDPINWRYPTYFQDSQNALLDHHPAFVGMITLKEVYHIARAKMKDPRNVGVPLFRMCRQIIGQAENMGIRVARERLRRFGMRDRTVVADLEQLTKQAKITNKALRRAAGLIR